MTILVMHASISRHASASPGSGSGHQATTRVSFASIPGCSVRSAQKPFTGTAAPPARVSPETSDCRSFHGSQDFSMTSFGRKHEVGQMMGTRNGKQGEGWIRRCGHTSGVRSIGDPRPVVSLGARSTTGYLPSFLWDERQDVPAPGLFSSFCRKRAFSRTSLGPGPFPPAGRRCHFLPRRAAVPRREPGIANGEPELFSSFCRNWCFEAAPDAAGTAALPGDGPGKSPTGRLPVSLYLRGPAFPFVLPSTGPASFCPIPLSPCLVHLAS